MKKFSIFALAATALSLTATPAMAQQYDRSKYGPPVAWEEVYDARSDLYDCWGLDANRQRVTHSYKYKTGECTRGRVAVAKRVRTLPSTSSLLRMKRTSAMDSCGPNGTVVGVLMSGKLMDLDFPCRVAS